MRGGGGEVRSGGGHRVGSGGGEGARVENGSVAGAAVGGCRHGMKGGGVYAYVAVEEGSATDGTVKKERVAMVGEVVGRRARAGVVRWAPGLARGRCG
ncbi:acetyl-coenzyme A synthetase, partial [Leptospira borgpetersenii serovar Hardjo-bovis]|nr:acetyl-coenzyme A synthetase [Leptospira borgpetersenii serovar Hardjo-bovis]